MNDHEMGPIGGEVHRQMDRLKQISGDISTTPELDWTEEDEARLQEELARVEFVPAHANPLVSDTVVKVRGREFPIHGYQNFPMALEIVHRLQQGAVKLGQSPFEDAYATAAPDRKYMEIFEALKAKYPALYKKTLQLERDRQGLQSAQFTGVVPKEQKDEEDYYKSQAYSAAAQIARELDPNYDLQNLTR